MTETEIQEPLLSKHHKGADLHWLSDRAAKKWRTLTTGHALAVTSSQGHPEIKLSRLFWRAKPRAQDWPASSIFMWAGMLLPAVWWTIVTLCRKGQARAVQRPVVAVDQPSWTQTGSCCATQHCHKPAGPASTRSDPSSLCNGLLWAWMCQADLPPQWGSLQHTQFHRLDKPSAIPPDRTT